MKSGDTYRFSLSWTVNTEDQIIAGEFLSRLGNKKSRFIVGLVCDYLKSHPEAMDPKETIRLVFNAPSGSEYLGDMIRSIIKAELAGKVAIQQTPNELHTEQAPSDEVDIGSMLENLDFWNQ